VLVDSAVSVTIPALSVDLAELFAAAADD